MLGNSINSTHTVTVSAVLTQQPLLLGHRSALVAKTAFIDFKYSGLCPLQICIHSLWFYYLLISPVVRYWVNVNLKKKKCLKSNSFKFLIRRLPVQPCSESDSSLAPPTVSCLSVGWKTMVHIIFTGMFSTGQFSPVTDWVVGERRGTI